VFRDNPSLLISIPLLSSASRMSRCLRNTQFVERMPVKRPHPVQPDQIPGDLTTFYTTTIYEKGSEADPACSNTRWDTALFMVAWRCIGSVMTAPAATCETLLRPWKRPPPLGQRTEGIANPFALIFSAFPPLGITRPGYPVLRIERRWVWAGAC